jgi:hypothetical protein
MSVVPNGESTQGQEPVLVAVGDISCTQNTVLIPSGSHPIGGTVWTTSNNTSTTEGIPTWAIVCAVLFVWLCLLSLLLLLVKEQKTSGYVQVSVQSEGFFYATQVPVSSPQQVQELEQRVNYIRGLAAAAG